MAKIFKCSRFGDGKITTSSVTLTLCAVEGFVVVGEFNDGGEFQGWCPPPLLFRRWTCPAPIKGRLSSSGYYSAAPQRRRRTLRRILGHTCRRLEWWAPPIHAAVDCTVDLRKKNRINGTRYIDLRKKNHLGKREREEVEKDKERDLWTFR